MNPGKAMSESACQRITRLTIHLFQFLTSGPHAHPAIDDMSSHVGDVVGDELDDKANLRQVGGQKVVRQPSRE